MMSYLSFLLLIKIEASAKGIRFLELSLFNNCFQMLTKYFGSQKNKTQYDVCRVLVLCVVLFVFTIKILKWNTFEFTLSILDELK